MQIDNVKKQQAIAHINELASKHEVFYQLLLIAHIEFLDLAEEMGIKFSKFYPDNEPECVYPDNFNFGGL